MGLVPIKFGVFSRFASTMLPAYMRPSGLERFMHSVGYPLVWGFWRLLELILKIQVGGGEVGGWWKVVLSEIGSNNG